MILMEYRWYTLLEIRNEDSLFLVGIYLITEDYVFCGVICIIAAVTD